MLRLPLGVSGQTAPSTDPHTPGSMTAVSLEKALREEELQSQRTFWERLENLILQGTKDGQRRTEDYDTYLSVIVFVTRCRMRAATNDDVHCWLIVWKDQPRPPSLSWHNAEVQEGQNKSKDSFTLFIQAGARLYREILEGDGKTITRKIEINTVSASSQQFTLKFFQIWYIHFRRKRWRIVVQMLMLIYVLSMYYVHNNFTMHDGSHGVFWKRNECKWVNVHLVTWSLFTSWFKGKKMSWQSSISLLACLPIVLMHHILKAVRWKK